jgi:hypothetical protein
MKKVWILIVFFVFITNKSSADDFRILVSFLSGFNHVFEYGNEEEFVMGENDFPVTPAHTSLSLGASCGYFLAKNFGLEVDGRFYFSSDLILRDPSDNDTIQIDSSRHFSIMADVIYQFLDKKIIPYTVAGIGLDFLLAKEGTTISKNGYEVDIVAPERTLDLLVNFGMGIKLFISKTLGLRGDIRYILLLSKPQHISNLNALVGLFFGFGGGK